jgi:hypothetical protein
MASVFSRLYSISIIVITIFFSCVVLVLKIKCNTLFYLVIFYICRLTFEYSVTPTVIHRPILFLRYEHVIFSSLLILAWNIIEIAEIIFVLVQSESFAAFIACITWNSNIHVFCQCSRACSLY